MHQATYTGDRTVLVRPCAAVPPAAGQVRIDVAFTGICGTDLHILHGAMDARVSPPTVLGHEMSGRIAEVGAGVTGWQRGDPVTVMPTASCGDCPACGAGHTHLCHRLDFLGIDSAGAMQNSWTVPAELLVRLPEGLRLDRAALVEPTAVAVHDVRRCALAADEQAVVVGAGPVGVLIALVARRVGADVLVVEPDAHRRSTAEKLGLACIDPSVTDVVAAVESRTGGAGAAVAFEVSGAAAGAASAVACLRARGRLVLVAIHPTPREVDLHRFFQRELTLLGARLYHREDFEEAVRLLAAGEIPVDGLVSRIEPLARADAAFAALDSGALDSGALDSGAGVMKVLVDCRPTDGTESA
ncbi:zinc-binding dehydrogenase [Kitasatospora sp. NPDC058170]|uniref:zinc-dependent alcohol dehydrogenase n=1 Tax=Kitasatospora sp. NPDC058170 TaxID=3346364 RepID=UPI0036DA0C15